MRAHDARERRNTTEPWPTNLPAQSWVYGADVVGQPRQRCWCPDSRSEELSDGGCCGAEDPLAGSHGGDVTPWRQLVNGTTDLSLTLLIHTRRLLFLTVPERCRLRERYGPQWSDRAPRVDRRKSSRGPASERHHSFVFGY